MPSAAPLNKLRLKALRCSVVIRASCAFHNASGTMLPGVLVLVAAAAEGAVVVVKMRVST